MGKREELFEKVLTDLEKQYKGTDKMCYLTKLEVTFVSQVDQDCYVLVPKITVEFSKQES